MKNLIQFIIAIILLFILAIILIFVFNPRNLRNEIIGGMINNYLSSHLEDYQPKNLNENNVGAIPADKHPILNAEQEAKLESFGVDVSQLPTTISPEMQECFIEKLGQDRVNEIIDGATPNPIELFKAKDCI